ncbi:exported hypothetical protein [Syntrophobacter sp. SbD1]|nr:exported hypothetical protein [Syntrophobacter sp. SbD1]
MRKALIIGIALTLVLVSGGLFSAQADCSCSTCPCWGDVLAAPFVAAGAIVYGAVAVSAAVVTAPFAALSCGNCCASLCNPCGSAPVSHARSNSGS